MKQIGGKRESPPISIQSEFPRLRSSMYPVSSVLMIATRKPLANTQIEKPDPQSFEQVPSKAPPIRKSATIPPRKIPRKHNSTFNIIIPAKSKSRIGKSRSLEPKYSTMRNANQSSTEIASIPSVNHEVTKDRQSQLPTSAISNLQVPINRTSPSMSLRSAWSNFTPVQTYWLRFAKGKKMEQ